MSYYKHIKNLSHKMSYIVKRTPLEYNGRLSDKYGAKIYMKREDLQFSRSYKLRPAYAKILSIDTGNNNNKFVCASAGNFAQSVAYLSKKLNIKSDIFLPNSCNLQKVDRIKKLGDPNLCTLHFHGDVFDDCLEYSILFSEMNNSTFLHPYDDKACVNGNATIAHEIVNQMKENNEDIDMIIGSIGGGGLMGGISKYIKEVGPNNCLVHGVESENSNSMAISLQQNKRIKLENDDTFIDGSAVKQPGKITFDICRQYIDEVHTVLNNRVCYDIIDLYQDDGIILELAGAMPISVLHKIKDKIKGKTIVLVFSGSNNDIKKYNEICNRKLLYENRLHYYVIQFYQKPNQLRNFIKNVLSTNDDIIRFEYLKKDNNGSGSVLIGIDTDNVSQFSNKLTANGYGHEKLCENDLLYKYLV